MSRMTTRRMRRMMDGGTMHLNAGAAVQYTWEALGLVWLVGLAFTKRTMRSQAPGTRIFNLALLALGFALLSDRWLTQDGWACGFFPRPISGDGGTGIDHGRVRLRHLGAIDVGQQLERQSDRESRSRIDHERAVCSRASPDLYGVACGCGGNGTGQRRMAWGHGLVLIVLGLMVKMSQEERLMVQTFPAAYPAYRQRVKALIPGIL